MNAPPRRRRPGKRTWNLQPVLTSEPGEELLPGAVILEELPRPHGPLLWQVFNDTLLWVQVPRNDRAGLFRPPATGPRDGQAAATLASDSDLEVALPMLCSLPVSPEAADEGTVAAMSMQVSRWAHKHGLPGTAWAYATLAASACPEDPGAAILTAEMAIVRRNFHLADLWFRRAVGLGRRVKDWSSYTRGLLGLAVLAEMRGDVAAAKRRAMRSLAMARRRGLVQARGEAFRLLATAFARSGDFHDAERALDRAVASYPRDHPERPAVDEQRAMLWFSMGDFVRATEQLNALLRGCAEAVTRARLLAQLARTAAAQQDGETFLRAASEAWRIISPNVERARFLVPLRYLCLAAIQSNDLPTLVLAAQALEDAAKQAADQGALEEARSHRAQLAAARPGCVGEAPHHG